MWKKVLSKVLMYLGQFILLLILIGFLAKTDNMPTIVPEEYVEKIVEYADKTLIFCRIIKDQKIIKKYAEAPPKEKEAPIKEVSVFGEKYKINIFQRIYNILFLNNYELNIVRDLNKTTVVLNSYINNQLGKLNNIIDSSYVKNIIKEQELGVQNEESYMLVNNIIYGFKYVEGFVIFDKNDKLITSIHKRKKLPFDAKTIVEKLKNSETPVDIFEFNNNTYFLYLIKDYEDNMNVLFQLKPEYFNTGLDNISIKRDFFVFDKNYTILNSNVSDRKLLVKLENAIQYNTLNFNEEVYNIKYLQLQNINLYAGILFKKYPVLYMALNFLKWLIIAVVLVFLCLGAKLLYKKLMEIRLKQKPSEMELVTGAMLEVAKSIKSVTNVTPTSTVNINQKDIEKVVNNAFLKYAGQKQPDDIEISIKKKQDGAGWKLIK